MKKICISIFIILFLTIVFLLIKYKPFSLFGKCCQKTDYYVKEQPRELLREQPRELLREQPREQPRELPKEQPREQPMYKGLCLFDIDGTLTTGKDNEKVIDMCLKAGYAVGISTAGAGYTPNNLLSFPWMPKNLYNFMKEHNFNTFNNVASNILVGKYDPLGYKFIKDNYFDHSVWGILKGHSLSKTAAKYNIKDPTKMILFDNDPEFIKGVKKYNKDMQVLCAGKPCGTELSPKTITSQLFNIND